jgi:outer membrane immunogenic protein
MKRVALALALTVGAASAARAADLPTAAPVSAPAYAVPYNWTGFYVGGNLGFGFIDGGFSDPLGNSLALPMFPSGQFLGGGQVGLNYEFNSGLLVGAEADFEWLTNPNNTSGTLPLANPPGVLTGGNATVTVNNRWLTTVTGRLGYGFDRVLFYAKGGGAWVASNNPTLTIDGAPVSTATSNSNWGWTGGVGVEWAFSGNWSARIEYNFVGLNGQTFTLPSSVGGLPAGDQFTGNNRDIQLVNAGINYKFRGW